MSGRFQVRAANASERADLAQRLQLATTPGFRAVVAVDVAGRMRAAAGFDRWTANAVDAHIWLGSPAAGRALLVPAFSYPFQESGRGVLCAWVRASNTRSRRLVERLGFQWTAKVPDGAAVGDDFHLYQMRRENCRWLSESHRKAA